MSQPPFSRLILSSLTLAACAGSESNTIAPSPSQPIAGSFTLSLSSPPPSEAPSSGDPQTLASIYENQGWSRTIIAADADGGNVTLRLEDNGNGDADFFEFDPVTGQFSLRATQDYERPQDADRDGKFELTFVAVELEGAPWIDFSIDIVDRKEIFEDFPVVWLVGETEFGGLGRNIVSLGDLDSDGRPDLAVAAPGRHARDNYAALPPQGYHAAGDLFVVPGETLAETTFLEFGEALASDFWRLSGAENELNLGYNMAIIDDLDDDGIDDFVFSKDVSSIDVISGATLVQLMNSGGESAIEDLVTGTLQLEQGTYDQVLDPRTFSTLGDIDDDGLADLAFCAHDLRSADVVEAQVFALSGAALKTVMNAASHRSIAEFYELKQAAYYAYSGNHLTCGPMTAIGDIDGDDLVDVAIPMPGPLAGDSGVLAFGGAELRAMLETGGRQQVTALARFLNGAEEPYTHFTDDAARATEQHHMVTPLGDVTGDGIDDFGYGWGRYHTANDSAYVVKGSRDLLTADGETSDLRTMIQGGQVVQLAASPDSLPPNAYRVEQVSALLAPEDGRHETLVFVGAGESTGTYFNSYALSADRLPDGGTAVAPLPIAGIGQMSIPRANGRQISFVTNVGDLNLDGYGDLAIGWDTATVSGPEHNGAVLLVSGAEIVERIERGERFRPSSLVQLP